MARKPNSEPGESDSSFYFWVAEELFILDTYERKMN